MRRLIIFTEQYPYGYHETFVNVELGYLSKAFDQIVIFPNRLGPDIREVPDNVLVYPSMSLKETGKFRYFIGAVFSLSPRLIFREISRNLRLAHSPKVFWRIFKNLEEASRVQRYLEELKEQGQLKPEETVLYTYWLSGQSLGVSLFKEKNPDLVFVSRAHRGDLYVERNNPPYLPFRPDILRNVDTMFPISEHGHEYLIRKYADIEFPVKVARLGVTDPGFKTDRSRDGALRLVSCSTLKTVKRVDLIIAGLAEFAKLNPETKIEWNHLGSGPLWDHLLQAAEESLDDIIEWHFLGQLTHDDVFDFYKNNPIDIFINVSSSEGIPVSIMEAQSCGIPVIATAVGGTPEIVNDQNGRLLSADPSSSRIAQAIREISADMDQKKANSRKQWEDNYNSEKNYQFFVNQLLSLLEQASI